MYAFIAIIGVLVLKSLYRAMHVSANSGNEIPCRPSVCPSVCMSVCPSVCDFGWKSWKLITRTISPTPSYVAAQRPLYLFPGEHGEILGRLEVGWEKVACWSTKAAISLKRVKIDEKLLWSAHKNSLTFFRPVPSPTSYSLPFPKIGGLQPQPKTAIAIISGTGKVTDFKFGRYIYRVHPNKRPWKMWGKRSVGVSRDCPNFLSTPIISGMGKATNFKFCTHICRIVRNRRPLKISAKVAVGGLRDSRQFSGHPYIGRIARSSLR